jgi:hypothetical protein
MQDGPQYLNVVFLTSKVDFKFCQEQVQFSGVIFGLKVSFAPLPDHELIAEGN